MFNNGQSQKSGDYCTNIQGKNIYINKNETEDFGIIEDILRNVLDQHIPTIEEGMQDNLKLINLKDKIRMNFCDENCCVMNEIFTHLWGRVQLVKKVIETENMNNEERVIALIDKIQADFRKLKKTPTHYSKIEYVSLVEEMALSYLPMNKKSNPEYVAYAKAMVLYFFELCYFGMRTKTEPKQKDLFDF